MDLDKQLAEVTDAPTFLAFVRALATDRARAEVLETRSVDTLTAAGGWENVRISTFLEAAVSWAESSSFGQAQGVSLDSNPWHAFAVFLYCGKIYE
jgi:hypothetical protein